MSEGAQENANRLVRVNGELQVTEKARKDFIETYKKLAASGDPGLPFPCAPKIDPIPYQTDIEDREKYPSWHKRWIDGTYKSVLETLNVPPNALIPIFDPTGLAVKLKRPIPDISLPELFASLAAPQIFLPKFFDIRPKDIPKFLKDISDLIVKPEDIVPLPKLPEIPQIIIPGYEPQFLNVGLEKPTFPKGITSLYAFDYQLITNIPNMFLELLGELMKYNWLNFNPNSIAEIGCKSFAKVLPQPSVPPAPPEYKGPIPTTPYVPSYMASLLTIQIESAPAAADAAAASVLCAAGLLRLINGTPKSGKEKRNEGISINSSPFDIFYGGPRNQDVIRTVRVDKDPDDEKAYLNGLQKIEPRTCLGVVLPKRKMIYADPITKLMLEGLAEHMYTSTSYRRPGDSPLVIEVGNITGWNRINTSGSRGHQGASVDIAYPMRDENGKWMSGIRDDSSISRESPTLDRIGTPFKGKPNTPLTLDDGNLPHDFEALYEMARWIFHVFQPDLVKNNKIEPWFPYQNFELKKADGGGSIPKKTNKQAPILAIIIGTKIYKQFSEWAKKTKGGNWNAAHPSLAEWNVLGMFSEQGIKELTSEQNSNLHEDHVHITGYRSILKSSWERRLGNNSSAIEEKYLVAPIRVADNWVSYIELEETATIGKETFKLRI